MVGKNRYELRAVEPVSLHDSRAVDADVYDDFLMFWVGDAAAPCVSVPIDTLTPSNVPTIAAKIERFAAFN